MNTNVYTNVESNTVYVKFFSVIGYMVTLKRVNEEKCHVKMLPWQQFLSAFSESYREVLLDHYKGILKV